MRALAMLLLVSCAHAAPLLALDDTYDCGFLRDGTLVAATAGGLRIGNRVVTALDGLPETHVDGLTVGNSIDVTTRAGTARVSTDGAVSHVVEKAIVPPTQTTFDVFGTGIVRARHTVGTRTCVATSDGVFVIDGAPKRVNAVALPTGDVAALAPAPGGLFIGTFDRGLYRASGERLTHIDHPAIHAHINALAFDAERDVLWIATARGLARCDADMRCRRVADRSSKHALLLLPGGRIAAGGEDALVFVSANGDVEGEATRKGGARFRSIWSLAQVGKTIYAGTTSGIFYGDEHTFTHAPETLARVAMARGTLPDDWVTALLVDGTKLYAGTYNAGIVALDLATMSRIASAPELGYVNPGGLSRLADGSIAVCTMDGLRAGTFGAWKRIPTLGRDVTAVVDGYVATRRGIAQLTGG